MAKGVKNSENESEAWNVAGGYVNLKILLPLVNCDKYIRIALYGVENIEENLNMPDQLKTINRIQALQRLKEELSIIIENTAFVMSKENKKTLEELKERIIMVHNVMNGISSTKYDATIRKYKLILNQEHFHNCLQELRNIKEELGIPLNKAKLIFPSTDEIDLDMLKREIIEGG